MRNIKRLAVPAYGFARGLEVGARQFLAQCGEFWKFDAGETIVYEGESHSSLFMVIDGQLSQRRQGEDGSVIEFRPIKRGRSFGEVNLFDPVGARATIVATTSGELLRIDRTQIEAVMDNDPLITRKLMTWLCTQLARRLRRSDDRYIATKNEYNHLSDLMDDGETSEEEPAIDDDVQLLGDENTEN
jgi:CRP-like cAMP-binding protein